jgi:type I site-specific restriction endonuclease
MTEIIERYAPGQARRVSQDTPKDERREMLADYASGRFQFLVNVGVLTEGFDDPSIQVVAVTRPTESRSLYAQMIGRGTRPLPGIVDRLSTAQDRVEAIKASTKPHVEVIDFTGNSGKHKLITTADILGGNYSDAEVAKVREQIEKGGGAVDVAKALEEARAHTLAQRERRFVVTAKTDYEVRSVNPFDVFDIPYVHERGWDLGKNPTANQIAILTQNGIRTEHFSRSQAAAVITEIMNRQRSGRASFKQAKELKSKNLDGNVSAAQAAILLGGPKADRMKAIAERYKNKGVPV